MTQVRLPLGAALAPHSSTPHCAMTSGIKNSSIACADAAQAHCGMAWLRRSSIRRFSAPCGIVSRVNMSSAASPPRLAGRWLSITLRMPARLITEGENNVHDCVGAGKRDTGINGCGNVLAKTGYACSTRNLVTSWREQWSASGPDTTDPLFPFGIVSLAAGTSEGHSKNMGNFVSHPRPLLDTKGYSSSYLAMCFATVRAGTWCAVSPHFLSTQL